MDEGRHRVDEGDEKGQVRPLSPPYHLAGFYQHLQGRCAARDFEPAKRAWSFDLARVRLAPASLIRAAATSGPSSLEGKINLRAKVMRYANS